MTRAPDRPGRRRLCQAALGAAALGVAGCAAPSRVGRAASARVVVVGGGFAGATAARYLRRWSAGTLDVVLIEPDRRFLSCPLSNLVLGGATSLDALSRPYDGLVRDGVRVVHDRVGSLDLAQRTVRLASSGDVLAYDRLVLAPGVELLPDRVPGLVALEAAGRSVAAWQAGPQTLQLRAQLQALPDGGVVAIAIPEAPYRCPPGPYERACQIAHYLAQHKPRAKLLVLDANADVTSKPALFKRVWAERHAGRLEYRPEHRLRAVDAAGATGGRLRFELQDDVQADVLNVIPPMRAGRLAVDAGLARVNGRWCAVDYRTFAALMPGSGDAGASRRLPDVHILGDAIQTAPAMPKSGHMANAHAKVAAAAIVAELAGGEADPAPLLTNTCYSFVDDREAMHVASVHAWDEATRTYQPVPGAGGLSPAPSALEGRYAWGWARTIWADMLG